MKKILFVIVFSCSSSLLNAQTIYLDESIYTTWNMSGASTTNPFHKFTFRIDTDDERIVRKTGHAGRHLRPYLKDCPEALVELNKFKTKRNLATTAGIAAIGYFIIYAAVDLSKADDSLSTPEEGPNMGAMLVPVLGLTLVDILLASSSNKHMYKAVELFNKRKASGDLGPQPKLIFGNARTSLGLRVAIQF